MNVVGASLASSGIHLKDNSLSYPTFESAAGIKAMGNASIEGGKLLGMVAIFLIQRNRHALIGRAIDAQDMRRVLNFLSFNPIVDAIYDCKSEVIGLGFFRFNAEIDFNRVAIVQNYHQRTAREVWAGRVVREEAVKVWDGPTGRAKCTPVFRTMCETKIN
eukprot:Gb_08084 [translate_table: standard]